MGAYEPTKENPPSAVARRRGRWKPQPPPAEVPKEGEILVRVMLMRLADIADLYSNPLELPFTPVELRNLAVPGDRIDGLRTPNMYQRHELSKRLGSVKVDELVRRARAGESVRSLARELGVANSALTRMLRDEGVAISRRKVSDDEAAAMARQYEAGSTVAELEKSFRLSHGAVLRSLHRSAVEMRPSAPRSKSA